MEGAAAVLPRPVLRDPRGRFVGGTGRPPVRRGGGQLGNLGGVRNPWATYRQRQSPTEGALASSAA